MEAKLDNLQELLTTQETPGNFLSIITHSTQISPSSSKPVAEQSWCACSIRLTSPPVGNLPSPQPQTYSGRNARRYSSVGSSNYRFALFANYLKTFVPDTTAHRCSELASGFVLFTSPQPALLVFSRSFIQKAAGT